MTYIQACILLLSLHPKHFLMSQKFCVSITFYDCEHKISSCGRTVYSFNHSPKMHEASQMPGSVPGAVRRFPAEHAQCLPSRGSLSGQETVTQTQSWASVLRSATLTGRHRAAAPAGWGWGFRHGLLEPPGSFLNLQERGPQKGQEH